MRVRRVALTCRAGAGPLGLADRGQRGPERDAVRARECVAVAVSCLEIYGDARPQHLQ